MGVTSNIERNAEVFDTEEHRAVQTIANSILQTALLWMRLRPTATVLAPRTLASSTTTRRPSVYSTYGPAFNSAHRRTSAQRGFDALLAVK